MRANATVTDFATVNWLYRITQFPIRTSDRKTRFKVPTQLMPPTPGFPRLRSRLDAPEADQYGEGPRADLRTACVR